MTEAGFIDCHCHVLPGIDDGPQNEEETKALLQQYLEEGVTTIIATSHCRRAVKDVSAQQYLQAFESAQRIAASLSPKLRLVPGNELYCEAGFMHSVMSGRCQVMGERYVLMEFPLDIRPEEMYRYLEILLSHGYLPVIAHVERYQNLHHPGKLRELREFGALIQVNTGSIMGRSGFLQKRYTRGLLRSQLIDLIGTDCHHAKYRPCRYRECAEYIMKHCPPAYVQQLLYDNPYKLISEQP